MFIFAGEDGLLSKTALILAAVILLSTGQALAQPQDSSGKTSSSDSALDTYLGFYQEEEVTLVSRKGEKLFDTAAAVYVITHEDIHRSGATNIPDALRMIPGVQVAQISANKWAISIRGFNEEFANKLLVLIDGRNVYTPLYGGVYWDMQNVMLDDVERIEVVRGSGGTLWGANAVNGVINIITKSAKDTQGTLVTAAGGNELLGMGSARYGGKLNENTYYRAYSMYFDRDNGKRPNAGDAADGWNVLSGGFRIDSDKSQNDSLGLQGDIFNGNVGQMGTEYSFSSPFSQSFNHESDIKGGNILGRWKHSFSESSGLALQTYYDRTERHEKLFAETRDTYDIDFQHNFQLSDGQALIWGLGYRFSTDNFAGTTSTFMDPQRRDLHLYSCFVQDEITLVENRLKTTVGVKLEHNSLSGFEYQPSARLAWTPNNSNIVWASVSRAVRTPTRMDRDIQYIVSVTPGAPPIAVEAFGNGEVRTEKVMSYELGYRVIPAEKLFFDFAAFFNQYRDLRSWETGSAGFDATPVPHIGSGSRPQQAERRIIRRRSCSHMERLEKLETKRGVQFPADSGASQGRKHRYHQ